MSRIVRFLQFPVLGALLLASRGALAEPPVDRPGAPAESPPDALFPHAGRFAGTVASGVPFVGIGEIAYGVTDGFALGAMTGLTPNIGSIRGTVAVGLRPRGVVFASGAWRSTLVAPVLYYPKVNGFGGDLEPWVLAQPTLTVERSLGPGANVHAGAGLIGAACMQSILTLGKEHDMMGGVWNTATVGGAAPLAARTSVFAEAGVVLRGVTPATDWLGGPVIAYVGVAREL